MMEGHINAFLLRRELREARHQLAHKEIDLRLLTELYNLKALKASRKDLEGEMFSELILHKNTADHAIKLIDSLNEEKIKNQTLSKTLKNIEKDYSEVKNSFDYEARAANDSFDIIKSHERMCEYEIEELKEKNRVLVEKQAKNAEEMKERYEKKINYLNENLEIVSEQIEEMGQEIEGYKAEIKMKKERSDNFEKMNIELLKQKEDIMRKYLKKKSELRALKDGSKSIVSYNFND